MLNRSTVLLYPFVVLGVAASIALMVTAALSSPQQWEAQAQKRAFYLGIMALVSLVIMVHNLFCNNLCKKEEPVPSTKIMLDGAFLTLILALAERNATAEKKEAMATPGEQAPSEADKQGAQPSSTLHRTSSSPQLSSSSLTT